MRSMLPCLLLLLLGVALSGCEPWDWCEDRGLACAVNHSDGTDRCWIVSSKGQCPHGDGQEGYIYDSMSCAELGFEYECFCEDPPANQTNQESCLREGVNCRCD